MRLVEAFVLLRSKVLLALQPDVLSRADFIGAVAGLDQQRTPTQVTTRYLKPEELIPTVTRDGTKVSAELHTRYNSSFDE